jgi:GT2 family glycosyltransferase
VGEQHGRGPVAVRYLSNPVANGPSGSRNLGVAHAIGSVVAFLDDDDVWEPGYLEQAVGLMHDADVVLTPLQWRCFNKAGRETRRQVLDIDISSAGDEVIGQNPGVTGSNVVIDRGVFQRCGGYDEDLWIGEDSELLARLLTSGVRVRVADACLASQLVHAGERLSRGGQRRVDGYRNLLRKTYATATPQARRGMALHYFDAKKDAARGGWSRWRYRLYAWSLAEPRDFVRRAKLRIAAGKFPGVSSLLIIASRRGSGFERRAI